MSGQDTTLESVRSCSPSTEFVQLVLSVQTGKPPVASRRATQLRPEVVFYPNNRSKLPEDFKVFGNRAKAIKAPMLVTNRVGNSWIWPCHGGCAVYSSTGKVLDKANREGKEEILLHELEIETT